MTTVGTHWDTITLPPLFRRPQKYTSASDGFFLQSKSEKELQPSENNHVAFVHVCLSSAAVINDYSTPTKSVFFFCLQRRKRIGILFFLPAHLRSFSYCYLLTSTRLSGSLFSASEKSCDNRSIKGLFVPRKIVMYTYIPPFRKNRNFGSLQPLLLCLMP